MEDLLLALLELFVEVVLEIAGGAVLDLIARGVGRLLVGLFELRSPAVAWSAYLVLGALTGWLSVFTFPHPIVRPSRVHGISLVVSPVATGALMSAVGSLVRRYGGKVTQIESFWYGFGFAFGMALVRFLFVM